MAKVAFKNENITSFGGIYHIIDVFSKLGFKNLPNLYWANVELAAKHSVMEVFLALSSSVTFVVENALRTSLHFIMSVEQAKRTSTYRTMTSDGRICPFPLWLRTWFS